MWPCQRPPSKRSSARNASAQRALLLSLGAFDPKHQLPPAARQPLVERLWQTYQSDDDAGVHSAIDWLLRARWGRGGGVGVRSRAADMPVLL